MKHRNLLTNLLYVLIIVSLVSFLLVEFSVFNLDDGMKRVVSTALLSVAILSVALIEIVLPVIANRDMLKNPKYIILFVIKTVFLIAAAAVLFLYEPFGVIKNMTLALILFVVFYFIQFFITLEPKYERKKTVPAEENVKKKPEKAAVKNQNTVDDLLNDIDED